MSTASRYLSELRETLGDELFTRTSQGFVPTPVAEDFHPQIERLIGSYDALMKTKTLDLQSVSRTINIACADNAPYVLMSHLWGQLQEKVPHLLCKFCFPSVDRWNLLRDGRLDILISPMETINADCHALPLAKQNFNLICGVDHPLIKWQEEHGALPDALINQQTFVDIYFQSEIGKSSTLRSELFPTWRDAKSSIMTPYFLPFLSVLNSSKSLMVLSSCAASWGERSGYCRKLKTVSVSKPLEPKLIWHERTHNDPLMQYIRSNIVAATKELADI